MTKRRAGILCVALGAVMLLAALLLSAMYEKRQLGAGYHSELLLQEFKRSEPAQSVIYELPAVEADEAENTGTAAESAPEMATTDYYGLSMIGVLRVPDCGIELPVLADWDYTVLDYAPCRYSGNIHSGDLIVMGHNYSTHFKPLKSVESGAAVEFETVDGSMFRYRVDSIESIHRDEPDKLASEHELILFTCEEYGVYRFVARCSLEEKLTD